MDALHPRLATLLACLLLLAPVFPAISPARADSATTVATLPGRGFDLSAVWDGHAAYVFGTNGSKIARFDPASATVTEIKPSIPAAGSSAVWDGAHAYIFCGDGGWSWNGTAWNWNDYVLRFDPATGSLTRTNTLLHFCGGTSAVWDGHYAYVFGGYNGANSSDETRSIVRYDPATDTATTMSTSLPSPRSWTSAVWDGHDAYIFGGTSYSGVGNPSQQILRYTPSNNTLTIMIDHGFPFDCSQGTGCGVSGTTAVWDGKNAYIFGDEPEIVIYTPAVNDWYYMSTHISSGGSAAVWDGRDAYLFGTDDPSGNATGILRYRLTPGAPDLSASRGPQPGQISLSWNDPQYDFRGETYPANSFPIQQYKIYRATTASGPFTLAATVGNVRTFTDNGGYAPGTARCYKVSAVNAAGEGNLSSSECSSAPTVPGAPTNLQALPAVGGTSLTWVEPGDSGGAAILGYRIYLAPVTGSPYARVATVGNVHQFLEGHCKIGNVCHYAVAAFNAVGEGALSNDVIAIGTASPI